jgi:hypothetical protein
MFVSKKTLAKERQEWHKELQRQREQVIELGDTLRRVQLDLNNVIKACMLWRSKKIGNLNAISSIDTILSSSIVEKDK